MSNEYTEARARSIRRYLDKTVTIQIRVDEETREKYRERAKAQGKSLTQHIKDLLDADLCNKAN